MDLIVICTKVFLSEQTHVGDGGQVSLKKETKYSNYLGM